MLFINCAVLFIVICEVHSNQFDRHFQLKRIKRQDGFVPNNNDDSYTSSLLNNFDSNLSTNNPYQQLQRRNRPFLFRRYPQYQQEPQITPYYQPNNNQNYPTFEQPQPQQPQYQPIFGGIDYIQNPTSNYGNNNNGYPNQQQYIDLNMNANNGFPVLNPTATINTPNQPANFGSIDLSNPHRAQPFSLSETDSEQIQFDNTEQLSAGTAISTYLTSPSQQLIEFPKFGKNEFSNINNEFDNSGKENSMIPTLYIDHNGIFKIRYGSDENNNDNNLNSNDDHEPLDNIINNNNNNDVITFAERIFTSNNDDDDDNINDKHNKSINDETKTATTSALNNNHTFYHGLPVFT